MSPAEAFQQAVGNLLDGRLALNLNLSGSKKNRRAREYALEGLYLVGVRSFESFLEQQMFGLASGQLVWRSRVIAGKRMRCASIVNESRAATLKSLMIGSREYLDYLPYDRTLELSLKLLQGGRPFSLLESNHKALLTRCVRVRNCIAHSSDVAQKKFVNAYVSVKSLRTPSPKPWHYLDDQIRAGVSFFEHDLAELSAISKILS